MQCQERLHLPSLRDKVKSFLEEFQVVDVTLFSKAQCKRYVGGKILLPNCRFLLENMKRYKKVDSLSLPLEDFKKKEYFKTMDIHPLRIRFRERTKTLTSCRLHYRSDKENISRAFSCISCEKKGDKKLNIDQLSHWYVCDSYTHLKAKDSGGDPDQTLCDFYMRVIKFRQESEENVTK